MVLQSFLIFLTLLFSILIGQIVGKYSQDEFKISKKYLEFFQKFIGLILLIVIFIYNYPINNSDLVLLIIGFLLAFFVDFMLFLPLTIIFSFNLSSISTLIIGILSIYLINSGVLLQFKLKKRFYFLISLIFIIGLLYSLLNLKIYQPISNIISGYLIYSIFLKKHLTRKAKNL